MRLALLSFLIFASFVVQAEWGDATYEDERPRYEARVASLQQQFNALLSQSNQLRNELDIVFDGYSSEERSAWIQQYESSADYFAEYEPFHRLNEDAKAAADLYRDAREVITPEQEVIPELRRNLWTKHIDWLEKRLATKRAQVDYLGSRNVHIEAMLSSSMFGFDLAEFMEDTFDDFIYVAEQHVLHVYDEFEKCMVDLGTSMMMSTVTSGTVDAVSTVKDCAKGMALSSITRAYESAAKKQFLDRLRSEGIHEIVAEHWWNTVTLPPKEDSLVDKAAGSALKSVLSAPLDPLKASLENAMDARLADTVADIQVDVATNMLETGGAERWKNAPALDAAKKSQLEQRMRTQIDSKVGDRTNTMTKDAVDDLVSAADFGVDYAAHVALIYMNSRDFSQMEANQIAKYRRIQSCLEEAGKNHQDPYEILGILESGVTGYNSFLRHCKEGTLGEDRTRVAEVPELEPYEVDISSLAERAPGVANEATEACAAFDEVRAEGREIGTSLGSSISAVESIVTARPVAIDWDARIRQARNAALQASEAALALGSLHGRARAARDTACGNLEQVSGDPSAADGIRDAATSLAGMSSEVERIRDAIVTQLEQARSALVMEDEGGSEFDEARLAAALQMERMKSAIGRAANAVDRVHASQETLLQLSMQAARAMAEARNLVEDKLGVEEHPALAELKSVQDEVVAARSRADCLSPEAPGRIEEMRTDLAGFRQRLDALDVPDREAPLAAGSGEQEIEDSIGDAEATLATAEIFIDGIGEWAALGEKCLAAAERVLARDTTVGSEADNGDDDTQQPGETPAESDVASASREEAPEAPPVIDVAPMIEAAHAAADRCDYVGAAGHARQLARVDPDHPWLDRNGDKVERFAERQRATESDIEAGWADLDRGKFGRASRHARDAAKSAMSCQKRYVGQLRTAIAEEQKVRQQANQEAAKALLGGLLELNKTLNDAERSSSSGSSSSSSSSTSSRTQRPELPWNSGDSCERQFSYESAYNPIPVCTCDGYRFDATKARCVHDPNARPVASGSGASGEGSERKCRIECVDFVEGPYGGVCREQKEICE